MSVDTDNLEQFFLQEHAGVSEYGLIPAGQEAAFVLPESYRDAFNKLAELPVDSHMVRSPGTLYLASHEENGNVIMSLLRAESTRRKVRVPSTIQRIHAISLIQCSDGQLRGERHLTTRRLDGAKENVTDIQPLTVDDMRVLERFYLSSQSSRSA